MKKFKRYTNIQMVGQFLSGKLIRYIAYDTYYDNRKFQKSTAPHKITGPLSWCTTEEGQDNIRRTEDIIRENFRKAIPNWRGYVKLLSLVHVPVKDFVPKKNLTKKRK